MERDKSLPVHLFSAGIAESLGLSRAPQILTTAANISPMVWWAFGPVRIYVPRAMVERLDTDEFCAILTHELGHVRRSDHVVRWLECLVSVALWWNPIAWWARRNLRACEEICCDAFVLSKTGAPRDSYAGALVNALERLAAPMIRPSEVASHVDGGFIERRIRMILSSKTLANTPRWVRGVVLTGAVLVVPLGLTIAQDYGDIERVEQWLESGVNSAFVTPEQADIMLNALRIAEKQRIELVAPAKVGFSANRIRVEAEPAVVLKRELDQADLDAAIGWDAGWFGQQVACGQITQSEADASMQDIRMAFESGRTNGPEYHERRFELGLISAETASRRLEMIAEMEQSWNQSPENLALRKQKLELMEVLNVLDSPEVSLPRSSGLP